MDLWGDFLLNHHSDFSSLYSTPNLNSIGG